MSGVRRVVSELRYFAQVSNVCSRRLWPIVMRARLASLVSCLLAACATHKPESMLDSCLRSYGETLPPLAQWAAISSTSPQIRRVRANHPIDDSESQWFMTSTGYFLLCRDPQHFRLGEIAAMAYIPDGADWKTEGIEVTNR
jgi:hypothetical protein